MHTIMVVRYGGSYNHGIMCQCIAVGNVVSSWQLDPCRWWKDLGEWISCVTIAMNGSVESVMQGILMYFCLNLAIDLLITLVCLNNQILML